MKDIERFQEWVNSEVEPEILKSIDNGNSHFIPINEVESRLDPLSWSTRNFQYTIFKDGYSNLKAIEPNTHFLATAKSECIKNAASDIGKYFGRGLNDGVIPFNKPIEKKVVKSNPDAKIMQQFANAVMNGDEATITLLSNMYDIKIENNVEESKN
jgi:hypothetical protein